MHTLVELNSPKEEDVVIDSIKFACYLLTVFYIGSDKRGEWAIIDFFI